MIPPSVKVARAPVLAAFITLSGLDGSQVDVNPSDIVSMRESRDDGSLHRNANCVINLLDGKFTAVTETCSSVRLRVEYAEEDHQ